MPQRRTGQVRKGTRQNTVNRLHTEEISDDAELLLDTSAQQVAAR